MTAIVASSPRAGSRSLVLAMLFGTVGLAFACSDDAKPSGTAAAGGSAGTPPLATGGLAGAEANSGGAPLTGSGGTLGSGGFGGNDTATGDSSAGMGGLAMSSGGQFGNGGTGSGSGGMEGTGGAAPTVDAGDPMRTEAVPSAGCALAAGRPAGGVVAVSQSHYFAFPERYDGGQPLPVLVGFHGCGGVNRGTSQSDTEWMRLTDRSAFATDYVRVVPLSGDTGGCWNYGSDIGRVRQMMDDLLANYCVDESRVFATGHSSGAQFIVQILTQNHAQDAEHLNFRGVAPVAASDYGPMTGPIPVMYIQGQRDSERGGGDGHETVARFRTANSCSDTSMPYLEVAGCQSGSTAVDPGCVSYDNCAAPTIWCSHNDPAYSGTMHGVPCFGVTAMHDFFESLM